MRMQSQQAHGLFREVEGVDHGFEMRTHGCQRRVGEIRGLPSRLNIVRATAQRAQGNAAPPAGVVVPVEVRDPDRFKDGVEIRAQRSGLEEERQLCPRDHEPNIWNKYTPSVPTVLNPSLRYKRCAGLHCSTLNLTALPVC